MLSEGIYPCKVVKTYLCLSSKDTPGVSVRVAINDDEGQTVEMTGTIWLSDAAINMARMQLKSFGFDVDTRELSELEENAIDGAEGTCKLGIDEYQGKRRLKIVSFGNVPRPNEKQILNAQQKLRSAKKNNENSLSAPPSGDDIPF